MAAGNRTVPWFLSKRTLPSSKIPGLICRSAGLVEESGKGAEERIEWTVRKPPRNTKASLIMTALSTGRFRRKVKPLKQSAKKDQPQCPFYCQDKRCRGRGQRHRGHPTGHILHCPKQRSE